MKVPYFQPDLRPEDEQEVLQTIRSGWLTQGPRVARLEKKLKEVLQCPAVVCVSSCTAALFLSLHLLELPPGSEVLTTPYTFVATANVILHAGLRPQFADIDPRTLNLNLEDAATRVTSRTRAWLPVYFAGTPLDPEALHAFSRAHGLPCVVDAAHALGARARGKPVGTESPLVCFSFYANKNLTTAEGGAIATNEEYASRLRLLRLHGITHSAWERETGNTEYDVLVAGYKFNLTDLQAALALHQLERFPANQKRRRAIAARYREGLQEREELELLPPPSFPCEPAYHLFPVLLRLDALRGSREELRQRLHELGVETRVHYPPVHLFRAYRDLGYKAGDFPVAEDAARREISLPLYPQLTDQQVDHVIWALHKVLKDMRR